LLGLLALAALALQALVEATRDLSLGRLGRWAERQGTALALAPNASDQNVLIQRVVGFSNFLTGPGIVAALSAPWIPIFLCVLWLLHPAFVALLIVLAATSIVVDLTAKWVGRAAQQNVKHYADQEAKILRSASEADAEKSVAILARNIRRRFADLQRARHVSMDQGEWMRTIQTAVRGFTRNLGQIGALALGALLVTIDQLSAGGMIAASILTSKAFASIEALSMQLPAIRAAKADYAALAQVSAEQDELEQTKTRPSGILRVENLIFPRGGGAPPRLERIAFTLEPGNCLALIGGSGSGKSTLLQALSGITPSPIGSVY
jgi:ABC-type protease/lipase transport system fused ATPase/permease subunit